MRIRKLLRIVIFLMIYSVYSMNSVDEAYVSKLKGFDSGFKYLNSGKFAILAKQHSSDEIKICKGLKEKVKKNGKTLEVIFEETEHQNQKK